MDEPDRRDSLRTYICRSGGNGTASGIVEYLTHWNATLTVKVNATTSCGRHNRPVVFVKHEFRLEDIASVIRVEDHHQSVAVRREKSVRRRRAGQRFVDTVSKNSRLR